MCDIDDIAQNRRKVNLLAIAILLTAKEIIAKILIIFITYGIPTQKNITNFIHTISLGNLVINAIYAAKYP